MRSFISKSIIAVIIIQAVVTAIVVGYYIWKELNGDEVLKDYLSGSTEIPYHVSIQLDRKHLCSGSLIHEKHVLTVANCVAEFVDEFQLKSRMKIFIGVHTLHDDGHFFDLDTIKPHPSYDPTTDKNNIAIIRLKEKVTRSIYINIIPLPDGGIIVNEGLELLVSGYDYIQTKNQYFSPDLHRINMKVIDDKSCQRNFQGYDMDDKFCAVPSPQYPPCKGDSGSPAATVDKKYIIGIFAEPNWRGCNSANPELFILVSPYLDFIKLEMAQ